MLTFKTLELCGYTRFKLSGFNKIEINFNKRTQLLLGTNGSGKSSLLKEISPLPAQRDEFINGGYKIITISKDGSEYVLTSEFTDGQKHSFVKDGVNLNPGFTVNVQRELVKLEFGITVDINRLLLGQTLFTRMGPTERNNWIMRLSETDYTFALNFYSSLRDKYRDVLGAMKHTKSKLAHETSLILVHTDQEQISNEIKQLKELLDIYIEYKEPKNNICSSIEELENELRILLKNISRKLTQNGFKSISIQGLQKDISELESSLIYLKASSVELSNMLEPKLNILSELRLNNITSKEQLEDNRVILQKQISELKTSLNVTELFDLNSGSILTNIENFFFEFDNYYNLLLDLFDVLNENGVYTSENYTTTLNSITNKTFQLSQLSTEQQQLLIDKALLEEAKQHNETECPECSHVWLQGFDESKYNKTIVNIRANNVKIKTLEDELETLKNNMEHINRYFDIKQRIDSVFTTTSHSKAIMDYYMVNGASSTSLYINSVISSRERYFELVSLLSETIKIDKLLHDINNDDFNLVNVEQEVTLLTTKINNNNIEINSKMIQLELLKQKLQQATELAQSESQIKSLMDKRQISLNQTILNARQDYINNCIALLKTTISEKEFKLSEISIKKNLVKTLTEDLENMQVNLSVIEMAIKALSPNEGLIAKGLMNFITTLLQQMNSFINQTWSYPLELLVTKPDNTDGELNYKFPLSVNGETPQNDIKEGSSSMLDIINLAFVYVAIKYLHLDNYPLFLDELGKSMDPIHRQSVYDVINKLIYGTNISQIFIVSHIEDCHNSLTDCDVIVLHGENVSIPSGSIVNEHVLFS